MKHWIEFTTHNPTRRRRRTQCKKESVTKKTWILHTTQHTLVDSTWLVESPCRSCRTRSRCAFLSAPQVIYIIKRHILSDGCIEFVDHSSRRLAEKPKFALFSCRDFFLSLHNLNEKFKLSPWRANGRFSHTIKAFYYFSHFFSAWYNP